MPFDRHHRRETREASPIAVIVCLAGISHSNGGGEEKTYTENVSLHGARVLSRHPWQPGEEADVTPAKFGTPVRGKVVYCKQLAMNRYLVGLNFSQQPVHWSTFTYPGVW